MDDDPFAVERFEAHVGSVFRVSAAGGTLALTLLEVRRQGGEAQEVRGTDGVFRPARLPFAITLRGPEAPLLGDAIHHLTHDVLGSLEIFLKPYHEDREGYLYEAVFN